MQTRNMSLMKQTDRTARMMVKIAEIGSNGLVDIGNNLYATMDFIVADFTTRFGGRYLKLRGKELFLQVDFRMSFNEFNKCEPGQIDNPNNE